MAKHDSIPPPKGTRDLYPEDLLRQRYITEAWRRVSIRHGFDEIAGPTFEMLDLYKKKSGEGIVSELFSFRRTGGDDDYALRPEFTPTLARMYAAKASSLPSPCKWFTAGPYFRAEKPQRGRLREFLQWNCDVMGGEDSVDFARFDAELVACLCASMVELGLSQEVAKVHIGERGILEDTLLAAGVNRRDLIQAVSLIDSRPKLGEHQFGDKAKALSLNVTQYDNYMLEIESELDVQLQVIRGTLSTRFGGWDIPSQFDRYPEAKISAGNAMVPIRHYVNLIIGLMNRSVGHWVECKLSIARGLAYYTGTVFELIADGERAIAGGGRYDNLIELFGGPPTPAVGFGMGDVVLGLLLEDKGLMPEGPALMDALSQKPASLRPEAFVVASEQGEAHVEPLLAHLRRGTESDAWKQRSGKPWDADRYAPDSGGVAPMHARRSYKSTKNIGKLLAEARKHHARFAVIIESDHAAKIENLESKQDLGVFTLDPASPDSIARALAREMGH